MPEIKYICLSDLHLGADNSLLTYVKPDTAEVDATRYSDTLLALVNCLRTLIDSNRQPSRPTLVLNGDVLELALALDNMAVMGFERLLELLFPENGEPLVDSKIIFVPGNHDHHLWETARESQYVQFLRSQPPGKALAPPWHTTKMFNPDFITASLLDGVIERYPHMRGVSVKTAYPNLGFMAADGTNCVIFTHGHFIEPIYRLMSSFRKFMFPNCVMPTQVWDIEQENFAWIDFFWSTLGRSGEVGTDVEKIYDMLLVPEMREKLAGQLGRALANSCVPHLPLGAAALTSVVAIALNHVSGLEKTKPDGSLTDSALAGLKEYLEGPLHNQFLSDKQVMPKRASVVFGHTHKPFSTTFPFKGFPEQTLVFNSGGWVVDTAANEPSHGGAVVLVDDQLNTAALRVYKEGSFVPTVDANEGDAWNNSFSDHLRNLLNSSRAQWNDMGSILAEQVNQYHTYFHARLDRSAKAATA